MSYLQRPPIDVHASAGCNTPESMAVYATERLLRASTGPFPFAGAIIRNALGAGEIQSTLEVMSEDTDSDNSGAISDLVYDRIPTPRFLIGVETAMRDWWQNQERSGEMDLTQFYPERFHVANELAYPHYDQEAFRSQEDSRISFSLGDGPLSVMSNLAGSVKYQLNVFNHNVLTDRGLAAFETHFVTKKPPKGKPIEVVVNSGDALLITNLKPTYHQVFPEEGRKTMIYFSGFKPHESLK